MKITELQRLIASQLDKRSMSARQASLLSVGRPDFVRDIKNGSMPAFDKACKLLKVLGLRVEIVPIELSAEPRLGSEIQDRQPSGETVLDRKIETLACALMDAGDRLNAHGKEMMIVRIKHAFPELTDETSHP